MMFIYMFRECFVNVGLLFVSVVSENSLASLTFRFYFEFFFAPSLSEHKNRLFIRYDIGVRD